MLHSKYTLEMLNKSQGVKSGTAKGENKNREDQLNLQGFKLFSSLWNQYVDEHKGQLPFLEVWQHETGQQKKNS